MFAMCDKSLTITIKRQAINRKEDYFRKVSWFLRAFANFFFLSKNIFETFFGDFLLFPASFIILPCQHNYWCEKEEKKIGIFSFWKKIKNFCLKRKNWKKIKFKVKQGWGKTFIKRVVHDCKGVNDFVTLLPHC